MNHQISFDWTKNQSEAFDLLRFPLVIAVIFIHMGPVTTNLFDADFSLFSWSGIYNVLGIMLSRVLSQIAVPTFFLISGYLFFANFRQWTWNGYITKIKSRIKTLIIPYIVWNCIAFLAPVVNMIVVSKGVPAQQVVDYLHGIGLDIFVNCNVWVTTRENVLGWPLYNTGPVDLPLWFLRDLIAVSILSPVIYYVVKKMKYYGIVLLFAAYLTRIWTLVPGFSINAVFFFTFGAYFAINGKNVIQFARKISRYTIPLSFILFCVCVVLLDGGDNVMPFYISTSVLVVLSVASFVNEKYSIKANKLLVKSVFFVYASHIVAIYVKWTPMTLADTILRKVIPGEPGLENCLCYILVPFLTATLCVCTYLLLSRYLPKVCAVLSGNRIYY